MKTKLKFEKVQAKDIKPMELFTNLNEDEFEVLRKKEKGASLFVRGDVELEPGLEGDSIVYRVTLG